MKKPWRAKTSLCINFHSCSANFLPEKRGDKGYGGKVPFLLLPSGHGPSPPSLAFLSLAVPGEKERRIRKGRRGDDEIEYFLLPFLLRLARSPVWSVVTE